MIIWTILKHNTSNESWDPQQWELRNLNNKSKKLFFENYFLNVNFFITVQCKNFKFCLHGAHTHSEGTLSQI